MTLSPYLEFDLQSYLEHDDGRGREARATDLCKSLISSYSAEWSSEVTDNSAGEAPFLKFRRNRSKWINPLKHFDVHLEIMANHAPNKLRLHLELPTHIPTNRQPYEFRGIKDQFKDYIRDEIHRHRRGEFRWTPRRGGNQQCAILSLTPSPSPTLFELQQAFDDNQTYLIWIADLVDGGLSILHSN